MAGIISVLPPSPATSGYNSLDGIEDLDAFLAAKGGLSHFPTPPLKPKDVVRVEEVEVADDSFDDQSDGDIDELDIATVFAKELSPNGVPLWDNVLVLEDMLLRARLPTEVLALAYNILVKIRDSPHLPDSLCMIPPDLPLTALLSLASTWTDDRPPPVSFWTKHVCDIEITPRQLDDATLAILTALDWRLLELSTPARIVATMHLFERRAEKPVFAARSGFHNLDAPAKPQPQTLSIRVDAGGDACWSHGQLTPDTATPLGSVFEEVKSSWLPLL